MSHEQQSHDDPLLQAQRLLPREDLSAAALSAQRERLHAELARVTQRPTRPHLRLGQRTRGGTVVDLRRLCARAAEHVQRVARAQRRVTSV